MRDSATCPAVQNKDDKLKLFDIVDALDVPVVILAFMDKLGTAFLAQAA